MANYITMKVPGARKAEEFIVYPFLEDEAEIKLQSDNRCVIIGRKSKNMYVSKRFAQYPRFDYCAPSLGGKKHPVPEDILEQAESFVSKSKMVQLT